LPATAATASENLIETRHGRKFDIANPAHFHARMCTATREQAEWIAQFFPKYVRVKVFDRMGDPLFKATVEMQVSLGPNKTNGDMNEAGIRRIKLFFKVCEQHGFTVDVDPTQYANRSPRTAKDYGWTA
jgi:hypothetical protein